MFISDNTTPTSPGSPENFPGGGYSYPDFYAPLFQPPPYSPYGWQGGFMPFSVSPHLSAHFLAAQAAQTYAQAQSIISAQQHWETKCNVPVPFPSDDPRNNSSPTFSTDTNPPSPLPLVIESPIQSPSSNPSTSQPLPILPTISTASTAFSPCTARSTNFCTAPETCKEESPASSTLQISNSSEFSGSSEPANFELTLPPSFKKSSFRPVPVKNAENFLDILTKEKSKSTMSPTFTIQYMEAPSSSKPSPTKNFNKYFFSKAETTHLLRHYSRDIQVNTTSGCSCEYCDFFTKFGLHFSDFEGTKNFISSNKLFFLSFPFLTQCNPERCSSQTSEECKHPKNENSFFYVHPGHLVDATKEDLDWVNLQKTPPSNKCRRYHCWDIACKKKHHPLTRRGPKI